MFILDHIWREIQLHNVNKLHRNLQTDGIWASLNLCGSFEGTELGSLVVVQSMWVLYLDLNIYI